MSSSANEDNKQFVWNGVDERNLSLLFWNTADDQTSKRLVSLLRIQAEAEKLSKNRKRQRRKNQKGKRSDNKGGDGGSVGVARGAGKDDFTSMSA